MTYWCATHRRRYLEGQMMVSMWYNSSDCCEIDIGIRLGPFSHRIQSPAKRGEQKQRKPSIKIDSRYASQKVLWSHLLQTHVDYVRTFGAVHSTGAMSFYKYLHDYDVSAHLDRIIQHFVMHANPNPCNRKGKQKSKNVNTKRKSATFATIGSIRIRAVVSINQIKHLYDIDLIGQ